RGYDALAKGRIQYIDGDHDVFGDGKVVLLSTPGHTPGHQSLYVKLARTGGVVVSGDLYHYTAERTKGLMPPREQTLETPASRKRIDEFLTRTHSQLWIGHAIDWYQNAVKAPGWYDWLSDLGSDRLRFQIVRQHGLAPFAAPARRLVAAKGQSGIEHMVAVDPDRTRLDGIGEAVGLADIAAPYA